MPNGKIVAPQAELEKIKRDRLKRRAKAAMAATKAGSKVKAKKKKRTPTAPQEQFPTGPAAAGVHFKPVRRVIEITEE